MRRIDPRVLYARVAVRRLRRLHHGGARSPLDPPTASWSTVPLKIKQDHSRFREIIRGRIKENLRKYIQKGEMVGKKVKDLITIPVPSIDIPHFKYGHKDQGGVGQGDGQPGTVLAHGAVEEDGSGKAGQGEGQHSLEVDLRLNELAEILGEELALPRIQSKGKKNLTTPKVKYTGVHSAGPESLRHFKRTYKQALKRSIASGTYSAKSPLIVPVREDKRYRTWKMTELPQSN